MVTPSTMPSTSAYKPFQVEFWLLGIQFVVTEAEHAGGRAELGKLIPPRLVLPMKYCNVFCEFCWPPCRTKSAQVRFNVPTSRIMLPPHTRVASSRAVR